MTHAILGSISGHRGLLAVRADADPSDFLHELDDAFKSFRSRHQAELRTAQDEIDNINVRMAAAELGAGQRPSAVRDPVYSKNYQAWVRGGEHEAEIKAANKVGVLGTIQASMSTGSPADGGYLAPIEWDRSIGQAQIALSPMRRIAKVVQTGTRAYSTLWNLKGWGSGWVGETAVRPETTAATLASLIFAHGEIYANPSATQQLLEDAQIDVAQFISDEIAEQFSKEEGIAFISGNGTNKPNGVLTYAVGAANAATHPGGALDTVTVASATAITSDELVGLFYGLAAPYRPNASWLMSSTTASVIAKLKDGNGNYIWRESLAAGQPQTLLGRPIEFDENMPAIAASAIPIAFGDFRRGYVINDRTGISILRDPYTAKPFVLFYARKRVGGGVLDPRALRVMKMAAA